MTTKIAKIPFLQSIQMHFENLWLSGGGSVTVGSYNFYLFLFIYYTLSLGYIYDTQNKHQNTVYLLNIKIYCTHSDTIHKIFAPVNGKD